MYRFRVAVCVQPLGIMCSVVSCCVYTGRFLSNINTTTVEVTCLLAATHSELPDALSAVTIVKCLDKLLPHVAFDLGPLEKKAASLEKSVAELRSMLEAQTRREAPQGLYS